MCSENDFGNSKSINEYLKAFLPTRRCSSKGWLNRALNAFTFNVCVVDFPNNTTTCPNEPITSNWHLIEGIRDRPGWQGTKLHGHGDRANLPRLTWWWIEMFNGVINRGARQMLLFSYEAFVIGKCQGWKVEDRPGISPCQIDFSPVCWWIWRLQPGGVCNGQFGFDYCERGWFICDSTWRWTNYAMNHRDVTVSDEGVEYNSCLLKWKFRFSSRMALIHVKVLFCGWRSSWRYFQRSSNTYILKSWTTTRLALLKLPVFISQFVEVWVRYKVRSWKVYTLYIVIQRAWKVLSCRCRVQRYSHEGVAWKTLTFMKLRRLRRVLIM